MDSASRSCRQGQAKTTCQAKQRLEVPAMSSCPLRLNSPASSGGASSAASQLLKWLLALAAPDEEPSPASVTHATTISFVPSTHKHFQEGLWSYHHMLNSHLVTCCCIQTGTHDNLMAMHTCSFKTAPQMRYFACAGHCTCVLGKGSTLQLKKQLKAQHSVSSP